MDDLIWAGIRAMVISHVLKGALTMSVLLGWIAWGIMTAKWRAGLYEKREEICRMETAYKFDDGDERKEHLEDTTFPGWWMDAEKRVDANLSREEALDLYHLEHKYGVTHGDEVLVLLQYRYLYLVGQWHEYVDMRKAS